MSSEAQSETSQVVLAPAERLPETPAPETDHQAESQRVRARRKEATNQIADELGEQETGPKQTIWRSVKIIGVDAALALLQKTHEIEAAGGMMLPDRSRKRTPGGVYFHLIRQTATADQRRRIFVPGSAKPKRDQTKEQADATHPVPPQKQPVLTWTWTERGPVFDEADEKRGVTKTVKVTLIGRPERIIERGQCVALTMQQAPKIPSLPAGLPLPPLDLVEQTRYNVYIAAKQWRKVAEAIKNPEDTLIVEGFQTLDQERGTIAVFASNVTTKVLQSVARQPKSS